MTAPPLHRPAVELVGIVKRFADHLAVDDVSLTIAPAEFFSLLGASGCGKTTTLRIVAGFETPTAGSVRLDGEDITARPAHLRPVGMVFQNYALFPHLSVFENIAFALRLRRTPAHEVLRRVGAALEMVRLPGLERRMPAQLSGGQQQRVALARALVFRPAVVLLDEPLGALDLKLRKAMQLELKALQRDVGLTFVYVTHDQEEALTMSDRIAVMDRGKVVQVADPRTIYERPASRFVADFIGVSNFLLGRLRAPDGPEAIIELADGQLVRGGAVAPHDRAAGRVVTVAVRPERMRLALAAAAGDTERGWNEVHGIVRNVVYTGSDTQYFVELGASGVVMVRVPNDAERGPAPAPGDRVAVRWEPESTAVLTG
jgi:spermidine/putrescine transport system ATP-binding protein